MSARVAVLTTALMMMVTSALSVGGTFANQSHQQPPPTLQPVSYSGPTEWEADHRVLDDTLNHYVVTARLDEIRKAEAAAKAAKHAAHQVKVRASRSAITRRGTFQRDPAVEACIIRRENGGSYGRSSNKTHFGRYQFSRSTWSANGGNPATWGSASPEEQDRVFESTVSRNGYSDWRPYNGC